MPMFIAALPTIAKIWKCPSTDGRVQKCDIDTYIYTQLDTTWP